MNINGKGHSESGLTFERKEIIKRRIAENYYDREDVLLEVARRILESHDLDDFTSNHKLRFE